LAPRNSVVQNHVTFERQTPQILLYFQVQHLVVTTPSGAETKLNVGAQLQTFPYSTTSKAVHEVRVINTWHGDSGGVYHYCTLKTFLDRHTVLSLGGAENLGKCIPEAKFS